MKVGAFVAGAVSALAVGAVVGATIVLVRVLVELDEDQPSFGDGLEEWAQWWWENAHEVEDW